jgi:general secretion pathway protein D
LFKELESQNPASTDSAVAVTPNQITRSDIAYFSPQCTTAEETSEPLQLALGDQVTVAAYLTGIRILVEGNANDLHLASDAVRQLDQPRPQLRITAMIYDLGLSELERLGINWSRDLRVNANAQNPA